jgi:hypothetical protein
VLVLVVAAVAAIAALVLLLRTARRSAQARPPIDPFTVGEPWRQLVTGALRSQGRYRELVAAAPEGAVREQLLAVGGRIDDAVDECWAIAQQGSRLDRTASQMRIETTAAQLKAGVDDPERAEALQARIDAHARLVSTARDAESRLRLLEARLQESAARGAELAVAGSAAPVAALESEVGSVTLELESLRSALEETSRLGQP